MAAVKWKSTCPEDKEGSLPKRKLQHYRGADTAPALLLQKTYHCQAALLQQDNSQWTGENQILSPAEIIRLDELDR
jgi:hypothetical protein